MRATVSRLSSLVLMLSVVAMRAVSVLWLLRNLDREGSRMRFSLRKRGVAEVLGRRNVVGVGAGVGEFLQDVEELLVAVCIVLDSVFEGGSLGGSDELVVSADGVLEGCEVVQSLILAPLSFESSAALLRFVEVGGKPEGLSVGASVGGILDWGKSIGIGVDPLTGVVGSCISVGGVGGWVLEEGRDKLVFGDLVPTTVGDPLWVVVCCVFLEGDVDTAVICPVEFGGVAERDMIAGRENRVECVSCGVGWCCDELFEAEVGKVVEQGGGVFVVGVLEVFGGAEGVFRLGCDLEGVLVDDDDASSWFVGAVLAGDLVAVRNGYGDVRR
ncbi:hypothetical protein NDU88_002803 [Pleurodeles waltl]|uniref:Uncharacterized protein n=1 Tax=Pleurodeles waltl TaxID=8319 RepID=A0AAV7WM98_PLEWA|nr:hypothetical protein NDU88_002803 [Pleurodeles waltl]